MAANLNILISGSGIAGSVLAFWLAKAGANVTVLEKAADFRMAGQGVDVRGVGLRIVQQMGLEEKIRAVMTKEEGLAFVDEENKHLGLFIEGAASDAAEVKEKKGSLGFVAEIEVMRGDLSKIFYEAAQEFENVKYHFSSFVTSIQQSENEVVVEIDTDGKSSSRTFDLVVAADGVGSKTRDLIFGSLLDRQSSFRDLGCVTVFFSIPREERDAPYSRLYFTTGRRSILTRPRDSKVSSAYVSILSPSADGLESVAKAGMQAQKDAVAEIFSDLKWESPRIMQAMQQTDDFYFTQLAQIKLKSWSNGRCAVVGDAGYCPSGISGMGTTVAIAGAYVLAGELVQCAGDYRSAFENYDRKLRPFVDIAQNIPLNGYLPKLVHPVTTWGLWMQRLIVRFIAWSGVLRFLGTIEPPASKYELPEYKFE